MHTIIRMTSITVANYTEPPQKFGRFVDNNGVIQQHWNRRTHMRFISEAITWMFFQCTLSRVPFTTLLLYYCKTVSKLCTPWPPPPREQLYLSPVPPARGAHPRLKSTIGPFLIFIGVYTKSPMGLVAMEDPPLLDFIPGGAPLGPGIFNSRIQQNKNRLFRNSRPLDVLCCSVTMEHRILRNTPRVLIFWPELVCSLDYVHRTDHQRLVKRMICCGHNKIHYLTKINEFSTCSEKKRCVIDVRERVLSYVHGCYVNKTSQWSQENVAGNPASKSKSIILHRS